MVISSTASMCQKYLDCECHAYLEHHSVITEFLFSSAFPFDDLILISLYRILLYDSSMVSLFVLNPPPKGDQWCPTTVRFLMDANFQGMPCLLILHWSSANKASRQSLIYINSFQSCIPQCLTWNSNLKSNYGCALTWVRVSQPLDPVLTCISTEG